MRRRAPAGGALQPPCPPASAALRPPPLLTRKGLQATAGPFCSPQSQRPQTPPHREQSHTKKPAPLEPAFWIRSSECPGTDGSGCRVLELLERAHLDLDRGGPGGEPLLFLGEGVDALGARPCGH